MKQELYQIAMKFAGEKHFSQKMKGCDANYLLHLSNVAMEVMVAYYSNKNFDINFAVQMAILHDILEDTDCTFQELEKSFGFDIAQGVQALSKDKNLQKEDRILDSLVRINELPKEIAIVKLADRITNLQQPPASWDSEKIEAYLESSKLIANKLSDKNEYLVNRIELKIQEYGQYLNLSI